MFVCVIAILTAYEWKKYSMHICVKCVIANICSLHLFKFIVFQNNMRCIHIVYRYLLLLFLTLFMLTLCNCGIFTCKFMEFMMHNISYQKVYRHKVNAYREKYAVELYIHGDEKRTRKLLAHEKLWTYLKKKISVFDLWTSFFVI